MVAVTGHVGHWELLGWAFARQGIPLHVIAQQNVDSRLTELAVDFRAKGNVHTVLRGAPGAAVGMLRALRRGEALGLLIDQDTRVQSVCVPFFGTRASTPRARRTSRCAAEPRRWQCFSSGGRTGATT